MRINFPCSKVCVMGNGSIVLNRLTSIREQNKFKVHCSTVNGLCVLLCTGGSRRQKLVFIQTSFEGPGQYTRPGSWWRSKPVTNFYTG